MKLRGPGVPVATLTLFGLLALPACGKKGPPIPPAPRGPFPPVGVAARQIGPLVEVSLRVGEIRGPKPSQEPALAELIRVDFEPGVAPPSDPEVFRRRGVTVDFQEGSLLPVGTRLRLRDGLEDLPAAAVDRTLRYAVRIVDRRGRPSPWVVAPDLVPVVSVGPPLRLTPTPTGDGVRLVWEPPAGMTGDLAYNLYRREPESAPASTPLHTAPLTVPEYLDGEVETGRTYRYVVRVSLSPGRPFREGESSAPVDVTAQDLFPPAVPEGLVAVQEGSAVRLFWDPNPNPGRDLAGYHVYRAVNGGPFRPLGPDPLQEPLYLDRDVAPGQHLSYRVTARDRATPPNESGPSAVVELDVVREPGRDRP